MQENQLRLLRTSSPPQAVSWLYSSIALTLSILLILSMYSGSAYKERTLILLDKASGVQDDVAILPDTPSTIDLSEIVVFRGGLSGLTYQS